MGQELGCRTRLLTHMKFYRGRYSGTRPTLILGIYFLKRILVVRPGKMDGVENGMWQAEEKVVIFFLTSCEAFEMKFTPGLYLLRCTQATYLKTE